MVVAMDAAAVPTPAGSVSVVEPMLKSASTVAVPVSASA